MMNQAVRKLLYCSGRVTGPADARITQAQVIVTGTASPVSGGALFQYNYTIANNTANDLVVVDIHVSPGLAALSQSITVPNAIDFTTALDSVLVWSVSSKILPGHLPAAPLSGFAFEAI